MNPEQEPVGPSWLTGEPEARIWWSPVWAYNTLLYFIMVPNEHLHNHGYSPWSLTQWFSTCGSGPPGGSLHFLGGPPEDSDHLWRQKTINQQNYTMKTGEILVKLLNDIRKSGGKVKTDDLQAHNASPCEALWACRLAVFTPFPFIYFLTIWPMLQCHQFL